VQRQFIVYPDARPALQSDSLYSIPLLLLLLLLLAVVVVYVS